MDEWKKDARRDVVFVDIDALVPKDPSTNALHASSRSGPGHKLGEA